MLLTLLIIATSVRLISSECRQSYITICDTFEDFTQFKDPASFSEVMIGGGNGTNMTSVDLMSTFKLNIYTKLTTLMVIKAINKLETKSVGFKCEYATRFDSVIFYGNIFNNIDYGHVPKIRSKKLGLVNNKIKTIMKFALNDHEVRSVDLSDNLLEVIEIQSLPSTNATKAITIRNNSITHIEVGSFPSSLETLNLDKNKLSFLHEDFFNNSKHLKELTLSHNNFNKIPEIRSLRKLVLFDISYNKISFIENNTFHRMDKLKMIDLSNNRLDSPYVLQWINTPGKQSILISLALNRIRSFLFEGVSLKKKKFVIYGNPFGCTEYFEIRKKLAGHEGDCDLQLSQENLPFCIGYQSGNYHYPEEWNPEIENFQSTLRNNSKSCILGEDRYLWLNPISYGCVL